MKIGHLKKTPKEDGHLKFLMKLKCLSTEEFMAEKKLIQVFFFLQNYLGVAK